MDTRIVFSTDNIAGRAPDAQDAGLYGRLFGKCGLKELQRNMHDYERHRIAPWTLSFGGTDMGVGGFRLGFGQDDGMELTLAAPHAVDRSHSVPGIASASRRRTRRENRL
jgi:hypothetical protein